MLHSALIGRWDSPGYPRQVAVEVPDVFSCRKFLIVLNNAASGKQIRGLLPTSPGSAVLVTSRLVLSDIAVAGRCRDRRRTPPTLSAAAELFGWLAARSVATSTVARWSVLSAPARDSHSRRRRRSPGARMRQNPVKPRALFDAIDVLDFLTISGDPRSCIPDAFYPSYRVLPDRARAVPREMARAAEDTPGEPFGFGRPRAAVDALVEANLPKEVAPGDGVLTRCSSVGPEAFRG